MTVVTVREGTMTVATVREEVGSDRASRELESRQWVTEFVYSTQKSGCTECGFGARLSLETGHTGREGG